MLLGVDRIVLRVRSLPAAVKYYTDLLGMKLIRSDARLATLAFSDSDAELVLHVEDELPAEGVFIRVADVRALYAKRAELRMTFLRAPNRVSRGYRATVKDPFGTVLHLIDRCGAEQAKVEDVSAPAVLFSGDRKRVV